MKKDQDLLVFYRKILAGQHNYGKKPTNLWKKAELLWAGEHYILVREGLYEGQRRTVLLNRESLLLRRGNPDKHPLIALALAVIHPVHKTHPRREVLLHSSRLDDTTGHELFNGLRWSKRLLCDLIFLSKTKDMAFKEDEESWIAKFEDTNAFSNRVLDRFEQGTDKKLYGPTEQDGYQRPPDNMYQTDSTAGPTGPFNGQVTIRPIGCSRTVRLVFRSTMNFNEEEFEVFVDALAEIKRMREERKQAATA